MAIDRQVTEGEEPVSPFARLFSLPGLDVFNIVTIGFKTETNPPIVVEGLKNTLINHPRFSSILVTGHGEHKRKAKWIPTKVIVEEHIIVPDIDPNIENPDEFLEDYTSKMALSPMDMSKPLWEFHLLKLKTSHAESVVVARFHHSLGDGMSLMSLLLACTRKTCDPEALPTFVAPKKNKAKNVCFALVAWLWFIVRFMFHTCVEVIKSMVFICCARDTSAHIMGKPGATLGNNKFIHQIISLDDVKMVKNAMNMTINDVLVGMVQAGLSRYLNERYDLEDKLHFHGVVFFNLRPNRNIEELANMMAKGSKCRWGNSIGYVLIPLDMKSNDDVFEYVRQSKTIMDRKKHSLEPLFSHVLLKLTLEVFGFKALETLIKRIFGSTTMIFTNVVGPAEEISFFGHVISYIAASTFGVPQGLIIGTQSYVDKLIINIGVDVDVIPDPHHLRDLIIEALHMMKSAVVPQTTFHASEV
ncbi:PREDICTED: O-acyltransferase WSD1-like [Camelina sativa]|uniref:O-acyltransferase WSD1-like n=1 Tax=Camelina sativa TaxID=90675 RepID=A0ABM0TLC2_CAMSA|nr:PREDICTED: O-acyltransferase WSD1-like [Camelina sativa]